MDLAEALRGFLGKPSGPPPDDLATPLRQMVDAGGSVRQGSGGVMGTINEMAKKYGLNPAAMAGMASIESSMDPGSNRNRGTQYKGLYQIGRDEWKQFGSGDIYNAQDNAEAMGRMTAAHLDEFQQRFGREPTPGELYMIHQQGMGHFTRGALTNVAGNPYPGMSGPQTPESFRAGWINELNKRMARFGGGAEPDGSPELHDILASRTNNEGAVPAEGASRKVRSPDFIAPPPGLGQAPNRVPFGMAMEQPPGVLGENAARSLVAGAVEPLGQAGRLVKGESEDPSSDLAGIVAAAAPMGPPGVARTIGKAASTVARKAINWDRSHLGKDVVAAIESQPPAGVGAKRPRQLYGKFTQE